MIIILTCVNLVSHLSPLEVVNMSIVDDLVVDANFLLFIMRILVKALNYLHIIINSFLVLSVCYIKMLIFTALWGGREVISSSFSFD